MVRNTQRKVRGTHSRRKKHGSHPNRKRGCNSIRKYCRATIVNITNVSV